MVHLTDLLKEIGDENLTFQILGQVVTDVGETENDLTEITFVTDQVSFEDIMNKNEQKIAFVVWADKNLAEKAVNDLGLGVPETEGGE